jgi:hypothetical protein
MLQAYSGTTETVLMHLWYICFWCNMNVVAQWSLNNFKRRESCRRRNKWSWSFWIESCGKSLASTSLFSNWGTAVAYLQCGKEILLVVWTFYLRILSAGSPFILFRISFPFLLFMGYTVFLDLSLPSIMGFADSETWSDRLRFKTEYYSVYLLIVA